MTLAISGDVEKFASIIPDRVRLSGYAENEIKATVKIIPEKKYPFTIKSSKAEKGEHIAFKLQENKKGDFIEYLVNIENTAKKQGRYFDTILLETDSSVKQTLTIKVFGNIMEKKETEGKESSETVKE
jgi:hypothetical protein